MCQRKLHHYLFIYMNRKFEFDPYPAAHPPMQQAWQNEESMSGVCPGVVKLNTLFRQLLLQTEQDAEKTSQR